ncbi:Bax inhibitor-1 family protein [Vibrio parahaemolyticus]
MKQEATIDKVPISAEEKVLKNTYMLLGMNLLTASGVAFISMSSGIGAIPWYFMLPVYFVLLYLVEKNADSAAGLPLTFVFTGFLGLTLGPILNQVMQISNGSEIITTALMSTAILFVVLSAWTIKMRLKMSKFASFLAVGMISAFIMSIMNVVLFQSSVISIVISTVVMFLSGAIIMWQTSEIINGGETNYIRATITLFVQIYNMFLSLIQLLGFTDILKD